MNARRKQHAGAFSLIEVIIAIGIFAGTIAVVLGLAAGLVRHMAEANGALAAQRLPDAVAIELRRRAGDGNFDQLAHEVPLLTFPPADGMAFVAARDSANVEPVATSRLSTEEHYFLLECWQFADEPLRYNPRKAFLAMHVRVSWPWRVPGNSAPIPIADRSQFTFVVTVNR